MSNRIIIVLAGLVVAALVAWQIFQFFEQHERRERIVRTSGSPSARQNPFLAAERFLTDLGVNVESISGRDRLLDLPSVDDTLVVNHFGGSLPGDRFQALTEWIEAGGHFFMTAQQERDYEDASGGEQLLNYYGIYLQRDSGDSEWFEQFEESTLVEPDEEAENSDPDSKQSSAENAQPNSTWREIIDEVYVERTAVVDLDFTNFEQPIQVGFNRYLTLDDSENRAFATSGSEAGSHLLQLEIGEGMLTVISDNDFLSNFHIGKYDHAMFLSLLVDHSAKVWLLYSSSMPALPVLVWQKAPAMVIATLIFLSLLLWRFMRRLGPILDSQETERRNLLEHLEASANYDWRVDKAQQTFSVSQAAVEHAWRRKHITLDRAEQDERCEWIAGRTGLTPQAVEAALYEKPDNEQTFMKFTAVLQKLAAKLNQHQE